MLLTTSDIDFLLKLFFSLYKSKLKNVNVLKTIKKHRVKLDRTNNFDPNFILSQFLRCYYYYYRLY